METTIYLRNGKVASGYIYDISKKQSGYGHWKISFDIEVGNNRKVFTVTTTDSIAIDEISEMQSDQKTWDEIKQYKYDKWYHVIEGDVWEWADDMEE